MRRIELTATCALSTEVTKLYGCGRMLFAPPWLTRVEVGGKTACARVEEGGVSGHRRRQRAAAEGTGRAEGREEKKLGKSSRGAERERGGRCSGQPRAYQRRALKRKQQLQDGLILLRIVVDSAGQRGLGTRNSEASNGWGAHVAPFAGIATTGDEPRAGRGAVVRPGECCGPAWRPPEGHVVGWLRAAETRGPCMGRGGSLSERKTGKERDGSGRGSRIKEGAGPLIGGGRGDGKPEQDQHKPAQASTGPPKQPNHTVGRITVRRAPLRPARRLARACEGARRPWAAQAGARDRRALVAGATSPRAGRKAGAGRAESPYIRRRSALTPAPAPASIFASPQVIRPLRHCPRPDSRARQRGPNRSPLGARWVAGLAHAHHSSPHARGGRTLPPFPPPAGAVCVRDTQDDGLDGLAAAATPNDRVPWSGRASQDSQGVGLPISTGVPDLVSNPSGSAAPALQEPLLLWRTLCVLGASPCTSSV